MRNALLFVTIYRGPVGVYLYQRDSSLWIGISETLHGIGETLSRISETLSWYWQNPFTYRRDPSLCIGIGWDFWSNIGWRGHLDGIGWDFWIGIINWKLGFLNKYQLEPLETKPVVSVATFGNETCSLWLSGCFLNGTSKLRNFLDDI
ncbi:unnamed protein product [Rhizophagus irregularis]|uniref:Uncharacterized protein n=1 Tax=Rhizophagus irregularis TaxID=588596 RepID=A0A916E540_9GLOM|nr:unnamed protein product [Rhizophagus irregularis]